MSTKSKPIELTNAITAADEAWNRYDAAVEANAPQDMKQELWNVVNWLEERKGQMYTAWQQAGGTSDIDCVTFQDRRPTDAELYDFTPFPKDMPIIDFEAIKEIQL